MILLLEIFLDTLVILISYILAYIFKFKLIISWRLLNVQYGNFYPHAQIEPYIESLYLIAMIWLLSLFMNQVYKQRRGVLSGIDEFVNILRAGIVATLLIIGSTYFVNFFPGSRHVLLYGFFLSVTGVTLVHNWTFWLLKAMRQRRADTIKAVVLGTDEVGQSVYEKLLHNESHRYTVVGALGPYPKKLIYSVERGFKYLGNYDDVWPVIEKHHIQEIFIATEDLTIKDVSELVDQLINKGVYIQVIPSFFRIVSGRIEANGELGLALFTIKNSQLMPYQLISKRIFDIIFSFVFLIVISPLFLIIMLLLFLERKGPVFYRQERVGLHSNSFNMLKFRTMPENVEETSGPVIQVNKNDQRATLLGTILRRTSLDELPQFINILKGEMSVVGPRPERPFFVKRFREEIPDYDKRHNVLPGLTGWAQVNGRSALSSRADEKVMYDLYYINNWSLLFDIKIMIKTIFYVVLWQGAY